MQSEILDSETGVDVSAWARGGFAGLVGIFLGVALSIAWQIALARVLGAAGLGYISLASTLFLILTTLVPLGLDTSAMRYVSFHYARKELAQTRGIIRFTALGSILLAMLVTPLVLWQSDWIAVRVFAKPYLGQVLRIVMLGLPFGVLLQVLGSILQGFQRIGIRLLAQQVLVPVFRLMGLLVIFLLVGSISTLSAAAVIAAAAGLASLVPTIVVFRQARRLGRPAAAALPPTDGLLRYSGRAFLSSAVEQISAALPVFLLGILSSSSDVGVFGASLRAALVVGLVLTSLNFIAAPAMSSFFATRNTPGLQSLYATITRWAVTLALPVFLILLIQARGIMAAFGPDFLAGSPVLQLLACGQMLAVLTGPCRSLLSVTDHQRLDVINGLVGLLVALAVSLLLIPSLGAVGAALGAVCYLALANTLGWIQAYRVLSLQPYGRPFLKPLVSGLVAAGLALAAGQVYSYAAGWMRLAIVSIVLLVAYTAVLLALRLEPQDRIAWRRLLDKRK